MYESIGNGGNGGQELGACTWWGRSEINDVWTVSLDERLICGGLAYLSDGRAMGEQLLDQAGREVNMEEPAESERERVMILRGSGWVGNGKARFKGMFGWS